MIPHAVIDGIRIATGARRRNDLDRIATGRGREQHLHRPADGRRSVAALLISKLFAVVLVSIALKMRRPRTVVFLNFWFAAVVSWNLAMILITGLRR